MANSKSTTGSSGAKNPGTPSGYERSSGDQSADDGSKNPSIFLPSTMSYQERESDQLRRSNRLIDAIRQFEEEQHRRFQEQEKDLRGLRKRVEKQRSEQSGMSNQIKSMNQTVENLQSEVSSLDERVSEVELDIDSTVMEDAAYDIADTKINDRIVKPIFLLISLLSLIIGISAFVTGPIIAGIALLSVTIGTWYLLYLGR
jgi:membrane-bound ClpP family serine protease